MASKPDGGTGYCNLEILNPEFLSGHTSSTCSHRPLESVVRLRSLFADIIYVEPNIAVSSSVHQDLIELATC